MRRIVGRGWIWTALVVAAWRGITELLVRREALAAAGELDRRIATRRGARIDAALARVGLLEPERVLAPVRVGAGNGIDDRVHAAVHVGTVRSADPDDVGLLEGAMRRATRERTGLGPAVIVRPTADRTDWGTLLEQGEELAPVELESAPLPAWAVPLATCGVALTLFALVRPLGGVAPWMAIAGLAVALAAWVAVRRR